MRASTIYAELQWAYCPRDHAADATIHHVALTYCQCCPQRRDHWTPNQFQRIKSNNINDQNSGFFMEWQQLMALMENLNGKHRHTVTHKQFTLKIKLHLLLIGVGLNASFAIDTKEWKGVNVNHVRLGQFEERKRKIKKRQQQYPSPHSMLCSPFRWNRLISVQLKFKSKTTTTKIIWILIQTWINFDA